MPISMYEASIPVLLRGLQTISTVIEKGFAHATETGDDPSSLVGARLASDMMPLSGQVQRASDTAKLTAERLTGIPSPKFPDEETTFEQLQDRIARTAAFLNTLTAEQFEGSETREIAIKLGGTSRAFTGQSYLLTFALPNFFFHVTTAYDILRQGGVPIGKRDYLGPFD